MFACIRQKLTRARYKKTHETPSHSNARMHV